MSPKTTTADLGINASSPESCSDLGDVRQALDTIDREIVALLGLRLDYVREAIRFKPDVAAIPAPERVAEMLEARQGWSSDEGLSQDFIVPLYAQIIQWFIQQQIQHWHHTRTSQNIDHDRPSNTIATGQSV